MNRHYLRIIAALRELRAHPEKAETLRLVIRLELKAIHV